MPAHSKNLGLAQQEQTLVRVDDVDTVQQVDGHERLLGQHLVAHRDADRQPVVVDDGALHTGVRRRLGQRTADERDGVLAEHKTELTGGADANDFVIGQRALDGLVDVQLGDAQRAVVERGKRLRVRAEGDELAGLRGDREAVHNDPVHHFLVDGVAEGVVDGARGIHRDDRIVHHRRLEAGDQGDLRGVASGFDMAGDAQRRHVAGNRQPGTRDQRAGEAINRQHGRALGVTGAVVHSTDHRGVTRGNRLVVLAHQPIRAEGAADGTLAHRRAVITDLLGVGQLRDALGVTILVDGQDAIAAGRRPLETVRLHLHIDERLLGERRPDLADDVVEERVLLGQEDGVDADRHRLHGGHQMEREQVLHGRGTLGVLDAKGDVAQLVQLNGNPFNSGILHRDVLAGSLALHLERAGAMRVHGVAEVGDLVLEVAVDQIGHHQIRLQDHQRLVRPDFGVQRIVVVLVHGVREGEDQILFHAGILPSLRALRYSSGDIPLQSA